jgi:tetratricopeptide (TPR) repeat protein
MKTRLIYLFLFSTFFIVSCSSKHEKLLAEIKTLEESIRNQPIPSKDTGGKLVSKYLEFAEAFPEDSLTPTVLYNASRMSFAISNPEQATEILEKLIDSHPMSKPIADAYVFLGFIYETIYKDYQKAKHWYELFLREFPNHAMYEDVSFSVKNLGKSPEELVAEFMKQGEER